MAGKSGGSWKVAYADFVTAMMAFFLVMWIGAQDSKVKQAVANYFIDPSGSAKTPSRTGATFDTLTYGSVPRDDGVAMEYGRNVYTTPGESSKPTKRVKDYLANDPQSLAYWKEQAARQRDAAAQSQEVREGKSSVIDIAVRELGKQLKHEMTLRASKVKDQLQMDLLFGVITEVNWDELAEDLLNK